MPYGKNIVGGSGGGNNIEFAEVPAGVIDGVNAVFTLTNSPNPAGSLQLYKNGVYMTQGTDYNLAGLTITYVAGAIPQAGDAHIASEYFW
jgi:hypothetical protein